MTDHTAPGFGTVEELGAFDPDSSADQQLDRVAQMIETHGEVHAQFTTVDAEVELRLGTTRINYDADMFEVWDGDTWRCFPINVLDHVYKPMGVFDGA